MLAHIEASEQGDPDITSLSGVPGVDWPKAITNLKNALEISWGGLARRLGIHHDQVTRLRNGKRRAGFVMADRIVGLVIEEDLLIRVFDDSFKNDKT